MNSTDFRKIILHKIKSALNQHPGLWSTRVFSADFLPENIQKSGKKNTCLPIMDKDSYREDLLDRFIGEISKVGGSTYKANSNSQVAQYVVEIAKKHRAKSIIKEDSLEFGPDIDSLCQNMDIKVFSYKDLPDADIISSADIGICSCDYGIAESGTLAVLSRSGRGRLISLLPPVHIALIKPHQILLSLAELFLNLSESSSPENQFSTSCLTLITGPSRTGDIEQTLTIGVHGPKELHAIIVPGNT